MPSKAKESKANQGGTDSAKCGHGTIVSRKKIPDVKKALVSVTAPNGEVVHGGRLELQSDGDYRVRFSSPYTGKHRVEIVFDSKPILGSPFFMDIFDPNKVRVIGIGKCMMGQTFQFDVVYADAGQAVLDVNISDPDGKRIPRQLTKTPSGEKITCIPQRHGRHLIYACYGGISVPGCPLELQVIKRSGAEKVKVSGPGLQHGVLATYKGYLVCDTRQAFDGHLSINVIGPSGRAEVKLTGEEHDGRLIVCQYYPQDIGHYNISIRYGGDHIPGSPFQVDIFDTRRELQQYISIIKKPGMIHTGNDIYM